jgi:4-hydroxy-L-threonine phosphate dehydrogenase PdxA
MRIAVIDGQGGGIGKAIVEKLRAAFGEDAQILALGTNAVAASLMLRSGANECASGENSIVCNAPGVDFIVGSVAIISANSMLGELTPAMAAAVSASAAMKVLLPLNKCNVHMAGVKNEPLPHQIDDAIGYIRSVTGGEG